jgi:chromosome partitioning protein
MRTIAVLNQKGGVGKSTIATNLAAAAHLKKSKVLVVDLDAQGSSFDWFHARAEDSTLAGIAVVKVDKPLSFARFREIASTYDLVILDGPAKIGDMTRSAAIAADVVFNPVKPGPFDLWGSAETLKLLDSADEIRGETKRKPARRLFVLNGAHRTNVSREAASSLEGAGVKLSPVVIHHRVAFAEAAAVGESVLTTHPTGPAADEIRQLYREVMK